MEREIKRRQLGPERSLRFWSVLLLVPAGLLVHTAHVGQVGGEVSPSARVLAHCGFAWFLKLQHVSPNGRFLGR